MAYAYGTARFADRREVGGREDGEDRPGSPSPGTCCSLARNEHHRNPRRLVRDPLRDGRVTDSIDPVSTLGSDDQQVVGPTAREVEDLSRRLAPGGLDDEGRAACARKNPDLEAQRPLEIGHHLGVGLEQIARAREAEALELLHGPIEPQKGHVTGDVSSQRLARS